MDEKAKQELELQHSQVMNTEAVERIKDETEKLTKETADKIEKAFFEDDEKVKLRDGKTYSICPSTLKDARKLMKLLGTVNIEYIAFNYLVDENGDIVNNRDIDLMEILKIAFRNYPELTDEYLEEYVDVKTMKKIVEILIGLNDIKK